MVSLSKHIRLFSSSSSPFTNLSPSKYPKSPITIESCDIGYGNFFFTLTINLSEALITYNIIILANATLRQELPGSSQGILSVDPIIKMSGNRKSALADKKRIIRTTVTASDSVYNTWQPRIMYYCFKKIKENGGVNCEMGGFMRILHFGKTDEFMDEIPTFVTLPLPAGID